MLSCELSGLSRKKIDVVKIDQRSVGIKFIEMYFAYLTIKTTMTSVICLSNSVNLTFALNNKRIVFFHI